MTDIKPVRWVGNSRDELRAFPAEARRNVGIALYFAQKGEKHPSAKPLRGFRSAGVLEIVENCEGDTYRAAYTVQFADVVYVLHAFKKKSTRGSKTPKHEIDLVKRRLLDAEADYRAHQIDMKGGAG